MKIWKKVIAGVGIGLLALVLGVGIWQKENVQALWEGMSYNEEQLKDQMETSKEKVQEALQEYEIQDIRDLTVEEEEKLMRGELSVEQALDLIMNRGTESTIKEDSLTQNNISENTNGAASSIESLSNTEGQSNIGAEGNKDDQGDTQDKGSTGSKGPTTSTQETVTNTSKVVEKYVEKMYRLQATFLSELGSIEARARATFAALPESERNLSTAQKLAPSFINQGLGLEKSCDSQVDALLNEFEAELKKAGASTAIVSNMRDAYQTQKRLKKAYYLSAIK